MRSSENPFCANMACEALMKPSEGSLPTRLTAATISSNRLAIKVAPPGADTICPTLPAHEAGRATEGGEKHPLLPHQPLNLR